MNFYSFCQSKKRRFVVELRHCQFNSGFKVFIDGNSNSIMVAMQIISEITSSVVNTEHS